MLGAVLYARGARSIAIACGAAGAALIVTGIVAPTRLGGVERRWMELAVLISRVTTPLFMGLIFLLVITPIAIVRRIAARNPLVHEDKDGSFWKPAGASAGRPGSMERQF